MRFGRIPLAEALGAVAGHTLRLGAGGVLKKGSRIGAAHIEALRAAGATDVIAACLDEDDIPENEAAARVAHAAMGAGVRVADPATGRSNLHALADGLVQIDRERIDRLNLVDEAVTLATLPAFAPVRAGDMVATVKIIPYAVRREVLRACEEATAGGAIRLAAFLRFEAGLILTRLSGVHESVIDRAAATQRVRAERCGGMIAKEIRCDHSEAAVAGAIREMIDAGCSPIWLLGASAIADRRDVIPAAIERAGGLVEHLGMPVDPGNLLLLGRLGSALIVGVPGCARSLKRSGFDMVIERHAAGLPVARADLMTLGAGGLLVEIPSRPQPRAAEVESEPAPEITPAPAAARVAAIVLAAGHSRRMGERNKLLLPVGGKPMILHVIDALAATPARPILVVTGHEAPEVRAVLDGRDIRFVHNADHEQGMGTSLRAGIQALMQSSTSVDGVLIALGDMPRLGAGHIKALLAAFSPEAGHGICVPTFERRRGNPVLFAARYFDELAALAGDVGARALIERHEQDVARVPVDDEGVLLDVDTPETLRALGADATEAD